MSNPTSSLPPGFRFHPTDEELILHYLANRAASISCPAAVVADVDVYKFDPWDLPAKAVFGDREWYFFSRRERKYPNGVRPNRAAVTGYWKATGTDKPIVAAENGSESIGVKKALVFYKGRPPRGLKSEWVMHEYRLPKSQSESIRSDDWVLCRIYKKSKRETSTIDRDRDQEDSLNTQQQESVWINESSSLSTLFDVVDYSILSQLLDTPTDLPRSEPLFNGNGYSEHRRIEYGEYYGSKKQKFSDSHISSDPTIMFNSAKNNLVAQPLFNQQLMMNYQPGSF